MDKQAVIWAVVFALLFLSLGVIAFPKTVYDEDEGGQAKDCQCFGSLFWYGTKCVGIPFNCSQQAIESEEVVCPQPSCEDIAIRLEREGVSGDALERLGMGTDVILVMDSSNSMEGDRLLAAKRAAQGLVDDLTVGERIGVITFNEAATVVHNFSDDRRSLTEGIMGITVGGGTNFLPALDRASEMMARESEPSRKGIIFLSDGVPSDDPDSIMNRTRELHNRGISFFTISFGIDELEEDNLLREMVVDASDDSSVSRWYREYTDQEDISKAFSEAWEEITTVSAIDISPSFDQMVVDVRDVESVGVWLRLESLMLTSSVADEGSLCVPGLEPELIVIDGENVSSTVVLSPVDHKYIIPSNSLPVGNYSLRVSVDFEANGNASCKFMGSRWLDDLVVVNATGACRDIACAEAEELLEDFDLALSEGVSLPRELGPGRVAILMDASESMRPYSRHVLRAVDRLNRLLGAGDERALILFSDEARLVVPFTRDGERVSSALAEVFPEGTTRMIPALEKTGFLFYEASGNDIAVVFTDGFVYDDAGLRGVEAEARRLVDRGVCLFFFAYGMGILDHKDASSLFRSLADYSRSRLGCGGYAYDPGSGDLSVLVTEMFGGERSDGALGLLIEIEDQPVFSRRLSTVSVQVVSSTTGLRLPASAASCLPVPDLSARLEDGRGRLVQELRLRPVDGRYEGFLPHLLPGRYRVVVDASLPLEGCGLSVSGYEEFVAFGSLENAGEVVVTSLIALIAFLIVLVSRQVRRSW